LIAFFFKNSNNHSIPNREFHFVFHAQSVTKKADFRKNFLHKKSFIFL
jgi:hypothetical protein